MMLKALDISKTYKRDIDNIGGIKHASITIHPYEYHCIYGASGSGKSTLMNVLSGMLFPERGRVYVDHDDLYQKKEKDRTKLRISTIGYIMQGASLLGNFTVYENIVIPLELAKVEVDYKQVDEIIHILELDQVIDAYPKELSGGEYRRTAFARTIVSNPQIILADEPTSNLDDKNAAIIRNVLETLSLDGTGVLVATHDKKFITDNHIIHNIENGRLY